jgi:hypothetical protein
VSAHLDFSGALAFDDHLSHDGFIYRSELYLESSHAAFKTGYFPLLF